MKIYGTNLETTLRNLNSKFKFFVLFGPEEGLIQVLESRIVKHFSPSFHEVARLNFKEVKSNLNLIIEQVATVSLFGERKLILIEDSDPTLGKDFENLLKNYSYDSPIVFVAGDLKPASSLRKFSETEERALSIACYKEEPEQIRKLIEEFLRANQFTFERDIPSMLSEILPPNRLLVQNELEKLVTYKFDAKNISTNDVFESVSNASELSFDDLCNHFILNSKSNIAKSIEKLSREDINFMMVMRVLQRFVTRLITVHSHLENSLPLEAALAKLYPPVFFKQKDSFIKIVKQTTLLELNKIHGELLKLEASLKSTGINPELKLNNYLLNRII